MANEQSVVRISVPSIGKAYGGPARTVTGLFRHLQNLGVGRFELWCGRSVDRVALEDSALRELSLQKLLSCGWREISQDSIFHDNGLWTPWNVTAQAMALRKGAHLIVSPRGMMEPWAMRNQPVKKHVAWWTYQRALISRASLLIATAPEELESIRALGIRVPVAIIPNGIELPLEKVTRWLPNKGRRTVLFLSRIHPKKGLEMAIEVWGRLRPTGWKFRIIGPGDASYINLLRCKIQELGLGQQVTIEGLLDGEAKFDAFRAADVFLLPTYSENFGVVVAEALAVGTPVITTQGTPWRELEERGCGWWIPIGVEPLVDVLQAVTTMSRESLDLMGEKGRSWVTNCYSWPAIAVKTQKAYKWVLSGRSAALKEDFIHCL